MAKQSKGAAMQDFIVFGRLGQFIVKDDSWINAIQSVSLHTDTFTRDWNSYMLDNFSDKIKARLLRESARLPRIDFGISTAACTSAE
jgi:hypothetical protein